MCFLTYVDPYTALLHLISFYLLNSSPFPQSSGVDVGSHFPKDKAERLGGPVVHARPCARRAAAPGLRCEVRVRISLQVRRGSTDLVLSLPASGCSFSPLRCLTSQPLAGEETGLFDGRYLLGHYNNASGQVPRLLGLCGC